MHCFLCFCFMHPWMLVMSLLEEVLLESELFVQILWLLSSDLQY